MGLFGKMFKNTQKTIENKSPETIWVPLTKKEDLNRLVEESETRLIAIFKHSTRCGISRMTLKRFEKEFEFSEDQVKLYFLDLLKFRELSQEIASRFGVAHESPQIIVVKGEKVMHHASHAGISAQDLEQFV